MSLTTLDQLIKSEVKLTPMMDQYYSIKKNYLDHILLFRMGDFYEVFFEDAKEASKILNITLTHRGKIGDLPIPMAGIPHHAAAAYVDRITNAGLKVAICEQVQDPKDAKGIVKRAVTQVVSPALPYDLDKTAHNEQRFILSGFFNNQTFYLVALDFTTGEFSGHVTDDKDNFLDRLRSYGPKEFITFMGQWETVPEVQTLLDNLGVLKTHLSEEYFNSKYTQSYIEKFVPNFKRDVTLNNVKDIVNPIGALSYYVSSTQQIEELFHIRPFKLVNNESFLKVSLPTLTGLEVLPKSREGYHDCLLGFLDKTQTAMGSRNLRQLFLNPLRNQTEIYKRQDLIQYFIDEISSLEFVRDELSEVRDIERILAKVSTGKATAGDLLNLSHSTEVLFKIEDTVGNKTKDLIEKFNKKEKEILLSIANAINETLNDEVGASLDKGNLIKEGANKQRDRLAKIATSAHLELEKLEERYREETGIQKLRVKSNNVAGFFIEVSKSHTTKVPKYFERRQTLVNSERYITDELALFEKDMVSAKDKLEKLEREIFKNLIDQVSTNNLLVQKLASIISHYDCFQALSWVAVQESFSRPTLVDEKCVELKGAWHPLIKNSIKDKFVSHDIRLDSKQYFGLITGPNMAGKTTVMREVAIVQIMAQIGSFVPALNAKVGICDYIFSRLGASDDILKGQSTFMVEMAETAEIIRHATERSLIILDEVGRGTSTYDGLSIAWALVEHLIHETKAATLFATHYHELIELVDGIKNAKNLTVETINNNGNVQFLYRLIEQGASQSFGIYVAKLAGIPSSILNRSEQILKDLEKDTGSPLINTCSGTQLSFLADDIQKIETPEYLKKIESEINSLNLSGLTPLEAMIKLDKFQKEINVGKLQ